MILPKFSYLLFIGLGIAMYAIAYKKNCWFGYRTKFSLKNDYNWKVANRIAATCFLVFGFILYWIHQLITSINTIVAAVVSFTVVAAVVSFTVLILVITELILYLLKRRGYFE